LLTAIIEIQAAGINSVVRFWAPEAGLYLAMNDKGMLYGTVSSVFENLMLSVHEPFRIFIAVVTLEIRL